MEENVKKALESIPMSKLNDWKDDYLIESQLSKQKNIQKLIRLFVPLDSLLGEV